MNKNTKRDEHLLSETCISIQHTLHLYNDYTQSIRSRRGRVLARDRALNVSAALSYAFLCFYAVLHT